MHLFYEPAFTVTELISYGESVTNMNDEANLKEASKEVLIKLNKWRYSEDNLKNIKSLAY